MQEAPPCPPSNEAGNLYEWCLLGGVGGDSVGISKQVISSIREGPCTLQVQDEKQEVAAILGIVVVGLLLVGYAK